MTARSNTRFSHLASASGIVLLVGSMLGCATVAPSKELLEARELYNQASQGPAAKYEPDQLLTAKQALERAERAHADEPASRIEKHLGYIAQRQALVAMTAAEQAIAEQQKEEAEAKYIELSEKGRLAANQELQNTERQLKEIRSELANTSGELGEKSEELRAQEKMLAERKAELEARKAELEKERQAREAAEKEAAEAKKKLSAAMQSLEEVAKVKAEENSWVITLSGAVLFASGKHELMPIAKNKLEQVAGALKETASDKPIVVEGHTDNVGPDQANQELSRKRAESVRSYLVEQGVDPKQISAVGKGENHPIAENTTAEGRANNRRVEIHVN